MLATEEIWKRYAPYFKPDSTTDNWGDPYALDTSILDRIFDFRRYLGLPIYVTRGAETQGHAESSYHYPRIVDGVKSAYALDAIIPDWNGNIVDLIFEAERFSFSGLGFYPHWKFNDRIVGGFHFDARPLDTDSDFTLNYREARWLGVLREGKQVYLPLTFTNLKKYGGL